MKSVKTSENIIIIKNSKFICKITQVNSKEEIIKNLNDAKQLYPNATHYCYAYILDSIKLESDDGEPSGTAGIPILQVLEKNNLNHVLCIVIRYFGKIKLGAGGLIRAYTKSVVECLKNNIITLIEGYEIDIIFSYNDLKKIDYLLKDINIINKTYDNDITYKIIADINFLENLKNFNNIKINIIKKTYF